MKYTSLVTFIFCISSHAMEKSLVTLENFKSWKDGNRIVASALVAETQRMLSVEKDITTNTFTISVMTPVEEDCGMHGFTYDHVGTIQENHIDTLVAFIQKINAFQIQQEETEERKDKESNPKTLKKKKSSRLSLLLSKK